MDETETLSITVSRGDAKAIRDRVAAGTYASTAELIAAALAALQRDEARPEATAAAGQRIRDALNDPAPSEPIDDVFDGLRRHLASRTARR